MRPRPGSAVVLAACVHGSADRTGSGHAASPLCAQGGGSRPRLAKAPGVWQGSAETAAPARGYRPGAPPGAAAGRAAASPAPPGGRTRRAGRGGPCCPDRPRSATPTPTLASVRSARPVQWSPWYPCRCHRPTKMLGSSCYWLASRWACPATAMPRSIVTTTRAQTTKASTTRRGEVPLLRGRSERVATSRHPPGRKKASKGSACLAPNR